MKRDNGATSVRMPQKMVNSVIAQAADLPNPNAPKNTDAMPANIPYLFMPSVKDQAPAAPAECRLPAPACSALVFMG